MKKANDHTEVTKVERLKKYHLRDLYSGTNNVNLFSMYNKTILAIYVKPLLTVTC